MNRKIEEVICYFVSFDKSDWSKHLGDFEIAYNSSINVTTTFFPFFTKYIIHPRTILLDIISADNPVATKFLKNMQESLKKTNKISKTKLFHYIVFKQLECCLLIMFMINSGCSKKNTLALGDGTGSRKLNLKYCGPLEIY